MNSLRQQGQFVFIDGFSGLFSPEKHDGINTITLNTRVPFIMTLTQHLLKPLSAQKRKPILFIEGLDFLLASTSISPNDLLGLLSNLSSVSFPSLLYYVCRRLIAAFITSLHLPLRRSQSPQLRHFIIQKP